MFTSMLHRRGPAVLAAGAAVAVLALVAPAGASTGPRQTSPEQAGYTADHAQFKYIEGTVYLRDPTQFASRVARYGHSVQLWSADRVVSLNFTASTKGETYTASATIYDRSTHQVIASDPNAMHSDRGGDYPGVGGPYRWGDQISLTISYSPGTGHLGIRADEETYYDWVILWSYELPGQSFTTAKIGSSFGRSPWDASYTYTAPAKPLNLATYTRVHLTSYSGHKATLWSWWMHHKLLAQPPGRGLVAIPHDLTGGGTVVQTSFVPKSAQSSS